MLFQEFPGIDGGKSPQAIVGNDRVKSTVAHYRVEFIQRFNTLDREVKARTMQRADHQFMVDSGVFQVQDANRSVIRLIVRHGAFNFQVGGQGQATELDKRLMRERGA